MRNLHIVVPTVGRPTCPSVVRDALEGEGRLARMTVVNQGPAAILDDLLRASAERRGVELHEIRLEDRVGPARARHIGATSGDEEFIGLLDDDIFFERGSLSSLVDCCEQHWLGGASGVLAIPATGRFARVAKAALFHSIFRDRRGSVTTARGVQTTRVLSGGMTVYRRNLYLRHATAAMTVPPFSCGEDVELSFQISRQARLALDPSVRTTNHHVQLSRGPADRRNRSLAHLDRYRSFADRHATTRRHWLAYCGVLVAVVARAVRRPGRLRVSRAVAGEALRAGSRFWRDNGRRRTVVPDASVDPPGATGSTVSAVVVFFRSDDVVERCVRALLAGDRRPDVVIVVPNSPVPPPLTERLERLGARVLPYQGNAGFATACNRAAATVHTEYLWFVNPEVRCDPTCLDQLLRHAHSDVIVAPTLHATERGGPARWKTASYLSPWRLLARELLIGRALRLGEVEAGQQCGPPAVSGACVLVPRAAFLRVKGFDERYFLYGEDVDLCLRLAAEGIGTVLAPGALATHHSRTGCGEPADAAVRRIKGRESKRAHYLLLERFRSPATAQRYVAGLIWVLRVRLVVARLLIPSVWDEDRAGYEWARAQAHGAGTKTASSRGTRSASLAR